MNRRDFFKFGLGGAGLAVGGGLACSKEKIPQPQEGKTYEHPWWVKKMDEAFGYGSQKSAEKWWHLNLPEYAIDTTQGKV